MNFIEIAADPSQGWFWLILLLILVLGFIAYGIIVEVAEVKHAKYQSFSQPEQHEIAIATTGDEDQGWFDLYEYTNWLAEKGALREGFGQDRLVEDYVANFV